MAVILPVDTDLADFVPKRRLITGVTLATRAVVTTSVAHGYTQGQFVRLHVDAPNPMVLNGVKTEVTIDPTDPNNDVNFVTNVDTTTQFAFAGPVFPPAFTQAHVVPITGDTMNIAGPLV